MISDIFIVPGHEYIIYWFKTGTAEMVQVHNIFLSFCMDSVANLCPEAPEIDVLDLYTEAHDTGESSPKTQYMYVYIALGVLTFAFYMKRYKNNDVQNDPYISLYYRMYNEICHSKDHVLVCIHFQSTYDKGYYYCNQWIALIL